MAESKLCTMICVDFGMTASGASWRDNRRNLPWKICFEGKKTPTAIASDGSKWNNITEKDHCNEYHEVRTGFKRAFAEHKYEYLHDTNHHEYQDTRIFLSGFCEEVLKQISTYQEDTSWTKHSIDWRFTIPGSWPEAINRDFCHEARTAVRAALQIEHSAPVSLSTSSTEGHSSAMFMLMSGSSAANGYLTPGNVTVCCDIGGLTTDLGAIYLTRDRKLQTLGQHFPISVGMAMADEGFRRTAKEALEAAGYSNSDDLARLMERGRDLRLAKVGQGSGEILPQMFSFQIPGIKRNPTPDEKPTQSAKVIFVADTHLHIHSTAFEVLFGLFVTKIQTGIDIVLEAQKKNNRETNVLALCGGGSYLTHAMRYLRERYESDTLTVLDVTNLDIRPELATLIGSTMVWDIENMRDYIQKTSFGAEEGGKIVWGKANETVNMGGGEKPLCWIFNFSLVGKGQVIAVASEAAHTFSKAKDIPHGILHRRWSVQIKTEGESAKRTSTVWKALRSRPMYLMTGIVERPGEIRFTAKRAEGPNGTSSLKADEIVKVLVIEG